jgi:hypothetical protein
MVSSSGEAADLEVIFFEQYISIRGIVHYPEVVVNCKVN